MFMVCFKVCWTLTPPNHLLYRGVQLLDLLPQSLHLFLHLEPLLLELPNVLHGLLQRHCIADLNVEESERTLSTIIQPASLHEEQTYISLGLQVGNQVTEGFKANVYI